MFGLKTHAVITGTLFAAIIVMAIAGNVLHDGGYVADSSASQLAAKIIFFALFLAFAFSTIPLGLKLFLAGQTAIGNGEVGIIRAVAAHQTGIVVGFWLFCLLGLAIAIPAAIQDGFLGEPGAAALGPSEGILVAAPGMAVDDMQRLSSVKIKGKADSVFAAGGVFDIMIGDTGLTLPGCRYYFITTSSADRGHIDAMSIGTSSRKGSRAELEAANATLRTRLTAGGWLAGHEVYRDEQDRTLHGGVSRGPSGAVWRKGETVLHILERRVDDNVKVGDPIDVGEWIQFVDFGRRANWPGIERYVFEPAAMQ
ncbi:MAG: hypothetical protein ACREB2_04350 [Pseudolabrys sp.]